MSTEDNTSTENIKTIEPVKFDNQLAKKTTRQALEADASDIEGNEIIDESPTQHRFVRVRGKNWEDLYKIHAVKLVDPDGEKVTYLVQTKDPGMFRKINNKCDGKIKEYVVAPFVSIDGHERIWCISFRWQGKSKRKGNSVKQAIIKGQQEWIRINWDTARGFVTRPPGEKIEQEPAFSTMTTDQMIDVCFEGRIIRSINHEAVTFNWNGVAHD